MALSIVGLPKTSDMTFLGTVDPNDPFLATYSTVMLSISVGCIIITEVILSLNELSGSTRNQSIRVSERQRNLWLLFGKYSLHLLISKFDKV